MTQLPKMFDSSAAQVIAAVGVMLWLGFLGGARFVRALSVWKGTKRPPPNATPPPPASKARKIKKHNTVKVAVEDDGAIEENTGDRTQFVDALGHPSHLPGAHDDNESARPAGRG